MEVEECSKESEMPEINFNSEMFSDLKKLSKCFFTSKDNNTHRSAGACTIKLFTAVNYGFA
jgi:hypothetical protein